MIGSLVLSLFLDGARTQELLVLPAAQLLLAEVAEDHVDQTFWGAGVSVRF